MGKLRQESSCNIINNKSTVRVCIYVFTLPITFFMKLACALFLFATFAFHYKTAAGWKVELQKCWEVNWALNKQTRRKYRFRYFDKTPSRAKVAQQRGF